MTVPSFTVNSEGPHLFFKASDKAALQARVANASGWKSIWDSVIVPRANTLKGSSNASLAGTDSCFQRLMILASVGFLTETGRPANGYKDVAIRAGLYLAGLADTVQPTNKRHRLLALATVFDICGPDMTTTEKSTLAAEIIQQIDRMTRRDDEEMDGWSGNDQMCALAGELAIINYPSYTTQAAQRLQATMQYLFGSVANRGRFELPRWQCSDGGNSKGGWYLYLGFWCELWSLQFLTNATNLDWFSLESSWASKAWEWLIWNTRGGVYNDTEPAGDMAKQASPKFHTNQRWALSILAGRYPNVGGKQGGQMLRWLYDLWDTFDSHYADNMIHEIFFMDKASVSPVAPKDATIEVPNSRLFDPPGVYYFRDTKRGSGDDPWDIDESFVYRINANGRYRLGHPHLDAGSVRIDFKGDPLLLAPAGFYDDFGGEHHANAYQRTWLQSLAPVVVDPSQVFKRYSSTVSNDGGQHFRKFPGFSAPATESDPSTVYNMLNDAGGKAWERVERFVKVKDDSSQVFLSAELREAYRQKYTDPHRCPNLPARYLVIKPSASNGLNYAALLVYVRIKKSDPSWLTYIPFHFAKKAPTLTSFGFRVDGTFGVGRLWCDIYNLSAYSRNVVAPGALDSIGYGADQFKQFGQGINYKPISAPSGPRWDGDIKTDSLFLTKNVREEEEHYVMLLMPTAIADPEPASSRSWVSDASYYGINLGSETHLLHKTSEVAVFGSADSTPPGEVSSFAAVGRDQSIAASWADPVDSDLEKVRIYIRTSAT